MNNLKRYDRASGQYVMRNPYYYFDGLIPYLIPHPLHYILFSQFTLYRWYIGGVWVHYQNTIWVRMEDRRKDEFCHEHLEMEPCCYCKAESEMYE